MLDDIVIRPAHPDELPRLPALQLEGGAVFRDIGMAQVADGPAPEVSTFAEARRNDHLLVAVTTDGRVVGFVLLLPLDGALHVEQVTVVPAFAGYGIGRELMRAAEDVARGQAFQRLTLTAFRDVAFNGPFYESLGWQALADHELTPGLLRVRAEERAAGLDRWPRHAMTKPI